MLPGKVCRQCPCRSSGEVISITQRRLAGRLAGSSGFVETQEISAAAAVLKRKRTKGRSREAACRRRSPSERRTTKSNLTLSGIQPGQQGNLSELGAEGISVFQSLEVVVSGQ